MTYDPRKEPGRIRQSERNKLAIGYFGKRMSIGFNPRTGVCMRCGKSVAQGQIKKTNMHHIAYIPIMVWACTVEVCLSCHNILDPKWLRHRQAPMKQNLSHPDIPKVIHTVITDHPEWYEYDPQPRTYYAKPRWPRPGC